MQCGQYIIKPIVYDCGRNSVLGLEYVGQRTKSDDCNNEAEESIVFVYRRVSLRRNRSVPSRTRQNNHQQKGKQHISSYDATYNRVCKFNASPNPSQSVQQSILRQFLGHHQVTPSAFRGRVPDQEHSIRTGDYQKQWHDGEIEKWIEQTVRWLCHDHITVLVAVFCFVSWTVLFCFPICCRSCSCPMLRHFRKTSY